MTTLPVLTKSDILKVNDLKIEKVPVPEWGGYVLIRSLAASELDDFEASILTEDGSKDYSNVRARFVSRCLIDESGNVLFNEEEAGMLGEKSAAAVDRIYDAATKLNGRSQADMEELAKNSAAAPSGDSPASSPRPPASDRPNTSAA